MTFFSVKLNLELNLSSTINGKEIIGFQLKIKSKRKHILRKNKYFFSEL